MTQRLQAVNGKVWRVVQGRKYISVLQAVTLSLLLFLKSTSTLITRHPLAGFFIFEPGIFQLCGLSNGNRNQQPVYSLNIAGIQQPKTKLLTGHQVSAEILNISKQSKLLDPMKSYNNCHFKDPCWQRQQKSVVQDHHYIHVSYNYINILKEI